MLAAGLNSATTDAASILRASSRSYFTSCLSNHVVDKSTRPCEHERCNRGSIMSSDSREAGPSPRRCITYDDPSCSAAPGPGRHQTRAGNGSQAAEECRKKSSRWPGARPTAECVSADAGRLLVRNGSAHSPEGNRFRYPASSTAARSATSTARIRPYGCSCTHLGPGLAQTLRR